MTVILVRAISVAASAWKSFVFQVSVHSHRTRKTPLDRDNAVCSLKNAGSKCRNASRLTDWQPAGLARIAHVKR